MRLPGHRAFVACPSIILILLLALSQSGCSRAAHRSEDSTIGVVLKSTLNPYFYEIEKGIRETAGQKGFRTILLVPEVRDPGGQAMMLEKVIGLKVKAILLIPETRNNCIPLIIRANSLNIPIVVLDTSIDEQELSARGGHVGCLITSDNEKGGRLVGDFLAKKLNGKGLVFTIEGKRGSYTGEKRKQGFLEIMGRYPGIKVLDGPPADFEREKAFQVSRELFRAHPGVKGVFAFNDLMALGASDAARLCKLDHIFIVGFDASEYGMKAIKEGRIEATITQDPFNMGKIGVESSLRLIKGENVPPTIYTRTELVTREKMELPFQ
jgi:ribose transport system substrate-binding protein